MKKILFIILVFLGFLFVDAVSAFPFKDSEDFQYKYEMDKDLRNVDLDENGIGDWYTAGFSAGVGDTYDSGIMTFTGTHDGSGYLRNKIFELITDRRSFTIEFKVKIISELSPPDTFVVAVGAGTGSSSAGSYVSIAAKKTGFAWNLIYDATLKNDDDFHVFRLVFDNENDRLVLWRDGAVISYAAGGASMSNIYVGDISASGHYGGVSQFDYIRADATGAYAPKYQCGTPGTFYYAGDLTYDCNVDYVDLDTLISKWLNSTDLYDSDCSRYWAMDSKEFEYQYEMNVDLEYDDQDGDGWGDWLAAFGTGVSASYNSGIMTFNGSSSDSGYYVCEIWPDVVSGAEDWTIEFRTRVISQYTSPENNRWSLIVQARNGIIGEFVGLTPETSERGWNAVYYTGDNCYDFHTYRVTFQSKRGHPDSAGKIMIWRDGLPLETDAVPSKQTVSQLIFGDSSSTLVGGVVEIDYFRFTTTGAWEPPF